MQSPSSVKPPPPGTIIQQSKPIQDPMDSSITTFLPTRHELMLLFSILAEANTPLETLANTFKTCFQCQIPFSKKGFQICMVLGVCLGEGFVTKSQLRIPAYYLLQNAFNSGSLRTNPFLPVFLHYLDFDQDHSIVGLDHRRKPVIYDYERWILFCIMTNPGQVSPLSTSSLILSYEPAYLDEVSSPKSVAFLSALYERLDPYVEVFTMESSFTSFIEKQQEYASIFRDCREILKNIESLIPRSLSELTTNSRGFGSSSSMSLALTSGSLNRGNNNGNGGNSSYISGSYGRTRGDSNSRNASSNQPMSEDIIAEEEKVRKIVMQAYKSALELHEQEMVLETIAKTDNILRMMHLTPNNLPDLVENSPNIAIECLIKLWGTEQITEFLSCLTRLPLSLHSMEVVNRLVTSIDMPTDYLHAYIGNCISACERLEDKYMQNRQVRLICVFLTSLIRNRIIPIQEFFIEIQSFCIQFSRLKEAAGLFRLLKEKMNKGDGASR